MTPIFRLITPALALATTLAAAPVQTAPSPQLRVLLAERGESLEQHDARMAWFREARFGMFIHWGLYSVPGGFWNGKETKVNRCAEWLMLGGKVKAADYAKLAAEFNPTDYDADAWVLAAKNAGMRYIVITTKHHEGFAMFKSAASPYNIVDATPYKRDPMKPLAEACRKHGVKLGFYYSQNLDWYHPGGGSGEWDPAHKGDADRYVDGIVIPQLREILSNYGEISVLWYDIPGGVINKPRADRIHKAVLACNPRLIINNRLGGGYHGDIETPENHIPPTGLPGRDWEACMTMNHTWGFAKNDTDWKSSETLIRNLADIASKGGNFLLNVGPEPTGRIPAASLERLAEVGAWMKLNAEAIRGTQAGPFPQLPSWGRVTARRLPSGDSRLYAIVFDSPVDGVLRFAGLKNRPTSARILGADTPVPLSVVGADVTLTLPSEARKQKNFVVALDLPGAVALDRALHPDDRGEIRLLARHAEINGGLKAEFPSASGIHAEGVEHLGHWTKKAGTARWLVASPTARRYAASASLAAPEPSGGSVIEFVVGEAVLAHTVKATGNWKNFATVKIGELALPAGESTITVRAKSVNGESPCNLGEIKLTPVNRTGSFASKPGLPTQSGNASCDAL